MKVDDIRLKCADNGFILCWTEIKPKTNVGSEFANDSYDYKELVFTDEQTEDAVSKMKELKSMGGSTNSGDKVKETY